MEDSSIGQFKCQFLDERICGREGLIGGILWYKQLEGLQVLFIKKGILFSF